MLKTVAKDLAVKAATTLSAAAWRGLVGGILFTPLIVSLVFVANGAPPVMMGGAILTYICGFLAVGLIAVRKSISR